MTQMHEHELIAALTADLDRRAAMELARELRLMIDAGLLEADLDDDGQLRLAIATTPEAEAA